MNYILNNLEELLNIPSPTGNSQKAMEFIENKFKELGVETRYTNKGCLIASLDGEDNSKEVTFAAHTDTLGGMVKEIKSNGRLKLTQLGGYSWNTIEGEDVKIETLKGDIYSGTVMVTKASSHVHGEETSTLTRNEHNLEVRIDEKVLNADDVKKLGINVGDFVHYDPRVMINGAGFIKSRHLDNKAGVVSLLAMAKEIKEKNIILKHRTNFFISNFEEVGHGAAAGIPENTVEFFAVDMAALGEGQTSDEFSVTICAKDSSGPYDYQLRKKLIDLAEENNIDYKIDIYPFYGSDASQALRAGNDIRAALFGPGIDASHSFERTHINSIINTIKLGLAYISK